MYCLEEEYNDLPSIFKEFALYACDAFASSTLKFNQANVTVDGGVNNIICQKFPNIAALNNKFQFLFFMTMVELYGHI